MEGKEGQKRSKTKSLAVTVHESYDPSNLRSASPTG